MVVRSDVTLGSIIAYTHLPTCALPRVVTRLDSITVTLFYPETCNVLQLSHGYVESLFYVIIR